MSNAQAEYSETYIIQTSSSVEEIMNTSNYPNLVTEWVRRLAPEIAPYELRLFHTQQDAYLANPEKVLKEHAHLDSLSGFELDGTMMFILPVLRRVLADVIQFVSDEFSARSGSPASETVQQFFSPTPANQQSRLTSKQVAEVRGLVLNQARQYRLSESKSQLLADVVTNHLQVS